MKRLIVAVIILFAVNAHALDHLSYDSSSPPELIIDTRLIGLYSTMAEIASFTGWDKGLTIQQLDQQSIWLQSWMDAQYPGWKPDVDLQGQENPHNTLLMGLARAVDHHDGVELILPDMACTVWGYRTDAGGSVTDILIDNTLDSNTDLTWHSVETRVYDVYGDVESYMDGRYMGRIVGLGQRVEERLVPDVPVGVPEPSVLALLLMGLPIIKIRRET